MHICIIKQRKQASNKQQMKKVFIALFILAAGLSARAQEPNSAANQTANLNLTNAIDITFAANTSATGAAINFSFNTVNDYANGLESAPVEVKVRSNRRFNVSVKSSSAYFTYSGATSPAPQMYVGNVLYFKMTQNNTGGWSWVNNRYDYIDHYNWTFLYNGVNGGNQNFTIVYRVTPGFTFPAGTYTTDVVYTATQQ
ncbi:hypothetical protein CAP35_15280 [Chitinophagaceae bacterium IBVUCB1]|nr:hypothetical protein CAP35_15280 [Chitinophagaceae bacterium IBVUCB1]